MSLKSWLKWPASRNWTSPATTDRMISGATATNSRFKYLQQRDFLNPQRMDYHQNLPCLSFLSIKGAKRGFLPRIQEDRCKVLIAEDFQFCACVYVVNCHVTWTRWRNLNTLLLKMEQMFALQTATSKCLTSVGRQAPWQLWSRDIRKIQIKGFTCFARSGLEPETFWSPKHFSLLLAGGALGEKLLGEAWDATGAAFLAGQIG